MSFPAIITPVFTQSANTTSFPGPFEVGGAIYVILQDQASLVSPPNWTLIAFKSIDGGNTWTQVGGESDICLQNGLYTSILVGTIIYNVVALPGVGGTRNIQVIAFDTATDTFSPGVDTGRTQGLGGSSNAFLCAGYRASDNTIIICNVKTNATPLRTFYFVYDIGSATAGPQIACGETLVTADDWDCCGVLPGAGGLMHLYLTSNDGAGNFTIHTQSLSSGGALGSVQDIDSASGAFPAYSFFSDGTTLSFAWTPLSGNFNPVSKVFTGASAGSVVLSEQDVTYTGLIGGVDALSVAIVSGGDKYAFFAGVFGVFDAGYNVDSGSGYGAFTSLGDIDSAALQGSPLTTYLWGLVLYQSNTVGAYFIGVGSPPPPPTPVPAVKADVGGGTYLPRFVNKTLLNAQIARVVTKDGIAAYREFAPLYWLYDFPNDFDVCLSREWRLFSDIDPQALACARKPDCFSGEEGVRSWVEPPSGAVTFNPDKAIPLPNTTDVNVVILSFRVPIAYDGILLAQYHAYRGAGAFVEGSGDIVWRVRVNGRYLRDMGDMQLSIGSPQTLSPCPGGLWLHSGNLVEYVVSAPNGSGALPLPGQGNILAGLHGWFWPRI